MNVKKIKGLLKAFEKNLPKRERELELYKWECLQIFSQNWDIEAPDFLSMYNASLNSTISRALWTAENYFPKQLMMKFIEIDPAFTRNMFKDLFNEEKALETRVDRFRFYCNELLLEYKRVNPTSIENNHYHDDYRMTMLYLAFRYPDKYTLYDFSGFQCFLKKTDAKNVPLAHDIERFAKVSRTLNKFFKERDGLNSFYKKRLNDPRFYQEDNLLPLHDFYRKCCALIPEID